MMKVYPFKFEKNYKKKIWGGESWVLSEHEAGPSVISNGAFEGIPLSVIVRRYSKEILGSDIASETNKVPLLFKFIDANDKLSIQVHPNDSYAKEHEDSLGKTEAWFVISAKKGAKLICGLKKPLTKEDVISGIENSNLEEYLQEHEVKSGDCFFVPAGTVHAIEGGLEIYEVQQVSDITYRLYDWGRVDENGNKRELHVEQSLKVMNFTDIANHKTSPIPFETDWGTLEIITACDYFVVSRHSIWGIESIKSTGRFKVITILDGAVDIVYGGEIVSVDKGETVLIPASIDEYDLVPPDGECVALITEVPDSKSQLIADLKSQGITDKQLINLGGLL